MRLPGWAACRVVIAVAALYALALQTLLGGVSIAASADPAHILCLQDSATNDGPDKSHASQGHPSCCLVAHALNSPVVPPVTSAVITWPRRQAVVTVWRPEVVAAPRAPPGVIASARAPPAA